MTCQEIRTNFEEGHSAGVNPACESAELMEHVAECIECRRFVEEQRELARCLLLLREGSPAIGVSLDASVLAGYRSYIAERPRLDDVSSTKWISPLGSVRWAAAIAFVVVAAGAALLYISGQRSRVDEVSTKPPSVRVSSTIVTPESRATAPESVGKKSNSIGRSATHPSRAIPVALPENWSSNSFQGLMYCDQLICPGAMDVIRVQLPSTAVGFDSSSSNASDFVYADVLVGPDGIARGIRVVE